MSAGHINSPHGKSGKSKLGLVVLIALTLFGAIATLIVANSGVSVLSHKEITGQSLESDETKTFPVETTGDPANSQIKTQLKVAFKAPDYFDNAVSYIFYANYMPLGTRSLETGALRTSGRDLELNWNSVWNRISTLDPGKGYQIEVNISDSKLWAVVNGDVVYTNNANGTKVSASGVSELVIRGVKFTDTTFDLKFTSYFNRNSPRYFLSLALPGLVFFVSLALLGFILGTRFSPKKAAKSSNFFKIVASVSLSLCSVSLFTRALGSRAELFTPPFVRFSDLFQLQILSTGDPYTFIKSNYPTFGLVSILPTLEVNDYVSVAIILLAACSIVVGLFTSALGTGISNNWPGIVLALSYPVIFVMDRANTEILVLPIVLTSLLFLETRFKWVAGFGLGMATALKVFPATFLIPLFRRKKYWIVIVVAAITGLFATLLSGKILGVGIVDSLRSLVGAGVKLSDPFSAEWFSLSLRSGILTFSHWLLPTGVNPMALLEFLSSEKVNLVFYGMIAICVAWALVFEAEYWSSTSIILTALIVLSPVTYEYRAIMLLVPLFIFARSEQIILFPKTLAVLFGLALSPLHFWGLNQEALGSGSVFSPAVYLVLLLMLIFDSIMRRFGPNSSISSSNRRL
jgi:hypothetical protein